MTLKNAQGSFYKEIILFLGPAASRLPPSRLEGWRLSLENGFGCPVSTFQGNESDFENRVERRRDNQRLLLAVGGDGTINLALNWIQDMGLIHTVLGTIPLGTGRDWVKSAGVPTDPDACVSWLPRQSPIPCDIGLAEWKKGSETHRGRFLNVTSLGISADVDLYVQRARVRHPFLYLAAALRSIVASQPLCVKVYLDDQLWFSGSTWILAAGNGRYFGGGMAVTPAARLDDGLLDVILVQKVSRPNLLASFHQIYLGSHIHRQDVQKGQAQKVFVECESGAMGVDLDGDAHLAETITLRVEPQAILVLASPEGPGFQRQEKGEI